MKEDAGITNSLSTSSRIHTRTHHLLTFDRFAIYAVYNDTLGLRLIKQLTACIEKSTALHFHFGMVTCVQTLSSPRSWAQNCIRRMSEHEGNFLQINSKLQQNVSAKQNSRHKYKYTVHAHYCLWYIYLWFITVLKFQLSRRSFNIWPGRTDKQSSSGLTKGLTKEKWLT